MTSTSLCPYICGILQTYVKKIPCKWINELFRFFIFSNASALPSLSLPDIVLVVEKKDANDRQWIPESPNTKLSNEQRFQANSYKSHPGVDLSKNDVEGRIQETFSSHNLTTAAFLYVIMTSTYQSQDLHQYDQGFLRDDNFWLAVILRQTSFAYIDCTVS